MKPRRLRQFVWVLAAIVCLAAGGVLQQLIERRRIEHELTSPGDIVAQNYPGYALLTIAPGGLRAPIVNYLWIRAEELKLAGRHYEAMQLADTICQLMPRFPGVWGFHAWNMAWNISVTTHTPQERWLWVHNGIKLLRDKGIPMNPKSLALYKELGWIFFSKMGQTADDMHLIYKQQWASQMQRLLAAPPYAETDTVIEAFRPVAEAPLDKDIRRRGNETVQADQRRILLQDPDVDQYAKLLSVHAVQINESLLEAYNQFSRDESLEVVRISVPQVDSSEDRSLYELINDDKYASARNKMLAFVRAQILWNRYKMDPSWMLQMMEKYRIPLDWRMVQSHGLYWVTYGIDYCGSLGIGDEEAMNIDRIVVNNLKALTWNGRLTYTDNPGDPDSPDISWMSDYRFIRPTHEAHLAYIEEISKAQKKLGMEVVEFDKNRLRDGHINFLVAGINMLYAGYRHEEAQKYLDWIKDNYSMTGPFWELDLVGDFVRARLREDDEPITDLARNQLTAAIIAAYQQLALGRAKACRASLAYAHEVYEVFQASAPDRIKLPAFHIIERNILATILIRPQTAGIYLDLTARSNIYVNCDLRMQVLLYDRIADSLRRQCEQAEPKMDFARCFPVPDGLEEYRERVRRGVVPFK